MLKKLFKNTFLRYMLSYVLLMAVLVGGIAAYMYSYYRKTVYASAQSSETAAAAQLKYLTDGYLTALKISADTMSAQEIAEGGVTCLYDRAGKALSENALPEGCEFALYASREELFSERDAFLTSLRTAEGEEYLLMGFGGEQGTALLLLPEDEAFASLTDEYGDACSRYLVSRNEIACVNGSLSVDESRLLSASGSEVRRIGGRDYLFVSEPSRFDGIRCLSVMSLNDLSLRAAGVWLGFAAVLLIFALPVVLIIYFISKKNLSSIAGLRGHFGAAEDTDDISAIEEGIGALEDRARSLESSSLRDRRGHFVRRMMGGEFDSREELIREAEEVDLNVDLPYCAVLLVGTGGEKGMSAEDLLPQEDGLSVMGMELPQNEQLLFAVFAENPDAISACARALAGRDVVRLMRLPVALSAIHEDAGKLPTAYLEATSAYESRFVMGEERLLRFGDISFASAGDDDKKSRDFASRLKEALSAGDKERTAAELDGLTAFLKSADMSLFTFRKVYNDIITAILSEAATAGCGSAEIYSLFSLSGCRSVDELDGILRRVCEGVISARGSEARLPLVQEVMRLMSESYTDSEFTISSAADKLRVTTVRLSQEFKNDVGVTPNDYLTRLRMEEAKRLLRQTDLPIRDVCSLSGYTDASSFTRRFRIYEGVTPLAYRQNVRVGS